MIYGGLTNIWILENWNFCKAFMTWTSKHSIRRKFVDCLKLSDGFKTIKASFYIETQWLNIAEVYRLFNSMKFICPSVIINLFVLMSKTLLGCYIRLSLKLTLFECLVEYLIMHMHNNARNMVDGKRNIWKIDTWPRSASIKRFHWNVDYLGLKGRVLQTM